MDVKYGCMQNVTKFPATFSRFIRYSLIDSSLHLKLIKRNFCFVLNGIFHFFEESWRI